MSDGRLRKLMVDAVPDTRPPADRWARIADRVRRRQRRRLAAAVTATVATVLVLTAGMAQILTSPDGPGRTVPGPAASGSPEAGPSGSPTARPPGVTFDPGRIPVGSPGSAEQRVTRTGEMPTRTTDDTGIFRTVCQYSHMNTDDALAAPGRPGASPLNVYWGNTAVTARSTVRSVATTGNSTCRGGTVDRSAYWASAVIDTRTGAPVAPEFVHVFYESGYLGVRPEQIRAIPAGLRMLAGDAGATAGQQHAGWFCWNAGARSATIPDSCAEGGQISMYLYFPQCWDGANLDSADHRGHLAYATAGKGCPTTHPVALPQVTYHVLYPVTDTSRWRLATDTDRAGAPGGYAIQGGWINGWREEIATTWVSGCVRARVTCGSHMLGDGRVLHGDK